MAACGPGRISQILSSANLRRENGGKVLERQKVCERVQRTSRDELTGCGRPTTRAMARDRAPLYGKFRGGKFSRAKGLAFDHRRVESKANLGRLKTALK